jgi:hypothetical protein
MAYRTIFNPKNPRKYAGDVSKIVCRSMWERNVCVFCDEHSSILKWSSEEIAIPYMSPIDKKMHNYYPDFLIQFQNTNGLQNWMVEVKPKKQTMLKENASKKEKFTWIVNNCKWNAAKTYCDKNNMVFKIITEKELFSNGNTTKSN